MIYALLVGDADKLEHIQRSLLDLFLGHFGVVQDGDLIDLIADPENRVEEVIGSWKIMEIMFPRISCIFAVGVLTMLSAVPSS